MINFKDNHLTHSAIAGGLLALILNRNGTSTRNSAILGGTLTTIAYLYMKKYGHNLPFSSPDKNFTTYSAVM